MTLQVILEVGKRRVFASALDWAGWTRAGKSAESAIEQMMAYHGRFAYVAAESGLEVSVPAGLVVVETLEGDATTDFGAPGAVAGRDRLPLTAATADRGIRLLESAWTAFDEVTASVAAPLTKGPRGGGREVGAIVEHVVGAEQAYGAKVGIRRVPPGRELRSAMVAMVRDRPAGTGWPLAYFLRRTVWHVLDHLWEVEDRAGLTPRSVP